MMLSSKQDRERLLSQQDRQRIEFMESCPKHESTNGTTRHEISKALKGNKSGCRYNLLYNIRS